MITCKVCEKQNDEYAVVCLSCGSFLQDRIPYLDYFNTFWKVLESPSMAFKRIIISEQKNYVLLQFTLMGIALSYAMFWYYKVGNNFDNLIYLMIVATMVGIFAGIPICYLFTILNHYFLKLLGGRGSLKNTYAVTGWSMTPIVLSVVVVLPVEMATLGLLFFSTNPSASEVKPIVYISLIILDILSIFYHLAITTIGLSLAHKLYLIRSLASTLITSTLIVFLTGYIFSLVFL